MPKIIFPEASNEYIQEVVKNLNAKNICEAIAEEMPVEQAAEKVPHGSARHYFANQRGLIFEVVQHLLDGDLPRPGETPKQQVARWLGPESSRTRARYELVVASFHDPDLAVELVRGRDRFVDILVERGMTSSDATELVAALDGLVLDALLRRQEPETVDPERIFEKFGTKLP